MSLNSLSNTIWQQRQQSPTTFPSKNEAASFIDGLFQFLFVFNGQNNFSVNELEVQLNSLRESLVGLILVVTKDEKDTMKMVDHFFENLEELFNVLMNDAAAVLQFDPAAHSLEEVLLAYPGFFATAVYRFANNLWRQGVRILPRLFSEYAHSKTGIDINPGASIGQSFFIDHGTGIVIGETCVIGDNVKIYQGVTLGALSVSKDKAAQKRHPSIEDNVVIYSGATILGGDTVVGHDSVIGGNVWLTASVLPYSIVYHKSDIFIKDKNPLPEGLNFMI